MTTDPANGGWRPIDSAPKEWTPVLLYWERSGVIEIGLFNDAIGGWVDHTDWAVVKPTHWHPLPVPPSQGWGED